MRRKKRLPLLKKMDFTTVSSMMTEIHQEEIEMVQSAEEVLNSIVPNYLRNKVMGVWLSHMKVSTIPV